MQLHPPPWRCVPLVLVFPPLVQTLPNRLNQALNLLADELQCNAWDMQFMINANTATSTVFKSMPWGIGVSRVLPVPLPLLSVYKQGTRL